MTAPEFLSTFDIKSLLSGLDLRSVLSGSAVSGAIGWVAGKWLERRKARRTSARRACARLRNILAAWYNAIADAADAGNTSVETENKLKKLWQNQNFEPAIQSCIDDMAHVGECGKLIDLASKYKRQTFIVKMTSARSLVSFVLEDHAGQFDKERAKIELRAIYNDLEAEISRVRSVLG